MLYRLHAKHEILHFLVGGSAVGYDLNVGHVEQLGIQRLDKQPSGDLLHVEHVGRIRLRDIGQQHYADVFLLFEHLERVRRIIGSNDNLKEYLLYFLRGLEIYLAVCDDDSAVNRNRSARRLYIRACILSRRLSRRICMHDATTQADRSEFLEGSKAPFASLIIIKKAPCMKLLPRQVPL